MGDVAAGIRNYINDELRLSQSDISSTLRGRDWFMKRIETVIANRHREPVLYQPEKFVFFGSYFKQTKVKAVDEYDVLVVIDSNTGQYSKGDDVIGEGQGSASQNYKYSSRFYKNETSSISPAKMLNWLKGAVEEVTDAFGGAAPTREGQAVTATISSRNFKIDLVPAGIFKKKSDGTIFYNIPKGDSGGNWIVTSPKVDIDLLKYVAREKNDFRNAIRIAKRIKDTYRFTVSSFAIETAIVYYGYYNEWRNNLYLDVTGSLAMVANLFRDGNIPDPYEGDSNLIDGVFSLDWYAERIDIIIDRLDKCADIYDQNKVNEWVYRAFENQL